MCSAHNMEESVCISCGEKGHVSSDCRTPLWCPLCASSDPTCDGEHAEHGRCRTELSRSDEWFFGSASVILRRWPLDPWRPDESKKCISSHCGRCAWTATVELGERVREYSMPYCCRKCMYSHVGGRQDHQHGSYCTSWQLWVVACSNYRMPSNALQKLMPRNLGTLAGSSRWGGQSS